ncbi:MAG: PKD domain-containing protein [Bacteroidia bacterium]
MSNPNIAQPLASPSTTTTYTLEASSNFGCGSDQDVIVITVKPTPEVQALSADTVICEGDEIVLRATHSWTTPTGSPVVYTWTPANQISGSPFLPQVTASPTQTTLYTVQASVASADCPTFDRVLVTVSPKVVAGVSADTTRICSDEETLLTATGGLGNATYTWSPATGLSDAGTATPMAGPDTTTTYTVIVSEGACADTADITIDVNPTPKAGYFTSAPGGCAPLVVSFMENAEGAISFEWDFGDGSGVVNGPNPTHVFELPGSYTVTLKAIGVGGCGDEITMATIEVSEDMLADFRSEPAANETLSLPGATVGFIDLSQNAVSWFWDFGDGNVSRNANPTHTYEQPGEYTVKLTVTDVNGCVETVEYSSYKVVIPEVMIPNVFSPNSDGINDVFRVQYNGNEPFAVKVFDRWGRGFFTADAPDKTWEGTDENGNKAPEGVYFYAISIGDKNYTGNVTLVR